jgi:hypothetical protein
VSRASRSPCYAPSPALYGDSALFQKPEWRDNLLCHEYFNGDTGEGLGASHQTGWTALAGLLIARRNIKARPG